MSGSGGSADGSRLDFVRPGQKLRFFLDLGPFSYPETGNVKEVSEDVAPLLDDWRKAGYAEVDVLILPSDRSFENPVSPWQELNIYSDRLPSPGN